MARKAVVAMSGGVDSSVAAALMVDAGYDVTGVMLKLWRVHDANTGSGCCSAGAAEDARRVADTLGIRFYVLNLAEHFEATVRRDFHDEYRAGRTPNPCVRCNQWVKFGALMQRAKALGADVLATGHYARVRHEGGGHRLLRAVDRAKDQSYVLWMLRGPDLARTRFPVGGMLKRETRSLAERLGLRTAGKPDSQEICFVPGGDFDAYADRHLTACAEPGPIVDGTGRVLGRHRGAARYTVGQRKGLGLALGSPVYVTGVDAVTNSLRVGSRDELAVAGLVASEVSFVNDAPRTGTKLLVQHRAHGDPVPAVLEEVGDGSVTVAFEGSVLAVAPGQSAAFYSADDPDELLGGGVISATRAA